MKRIITAIIALTLVLSACEVEPEVSSSSGPSGSFDPVPTELMPTPEPVPTPQPVQVPVSASVADMFISNLQLMDHDALALQAVTNLTDWEIEQLVDAFCQMAVASVSLDDFSLMAIEANREGLFTMDEMAAIAVAAVLTSCPSQGERLFS